MFTAVFTPEPKVGDTVKEAVVGALIIPTLPAKYAFPVVVAPPEIVSPPACVPSPIVELANAVNPPLN
jgi:hypothetical protein